MKLGNIPKKHSNIKSGFLPPPIPFEKPKKATLGKEDYLAMKLRSNPADEKSGLYDLVVPYFHNGTAEEWFGFTKNLANVFIGQNLTTGPTQYAMARQLLQGNCLTQFDSKADKLGNKSVPNFKLVMRAVTESVMPLRAVQTQKRYMRRLLRKPKKMKIRAYYARYLELNKYLPQFPPFSDTQKISDDEIKEHAEFAIPNAWQRQMTLHGFEMIDHTMSEFIDFCERLEVTEDIYDGAHKQHGQTANTQKGKDGTHSLMNGGKSNQGRKRKGSSDLKYKCLYHGDNNTHNTNDCKVMKKQANSMASAHAGRAGKINGPGKTTRRRKKRRRFNISLL